MLGTLLGLGGSLLGGWLTNKSSEDGKAHRYTKQRNAEIDAYARQMQEQSRADLMNLFPGAFDNMNMGYQSTLDMLNQSLPMQASTFQQGNMNAQNTLLNGMDPYMAALMGNPIDMSGLQARGVDYNFDWIPQQLPQYQSPAQLLGGENPYAQGATGVGGMNDQINNPYNRNRY